MPIVNDFTKHYKITTYLRYNLKINVKIGSKSGPFADIHIIIYTNITNNDSNCIIKSQLPIQSLSN